VPREIKAAVALSVPFDLALSAQTLDAPGFWRWVYRTRFLRSLKRKSLAKLKKFPGAADAIGSGGHARCSSRRCAHRPHPRIRQRADYYAQSSSRSFVERVRVPLLLLSAADDPFIPAQCIPRPTNGSVTLEISAEGGHLGFVEGPPWRPRFYAERRTVEFSRST